MVCSIINKFMFKLVYSDIFLNTIEINFFKLYIFLFVNCKIPKMLLKIIFYEIIICYVI